MRCPRLVHVVGFLSIALLALGAAPSVTLAALPDSLVAYWNFDFGFQATTGGPSFDAVQHNGVTIDAAGRFGSAALFTRSLSQYLDVSAPVITQGQDHTYSAWYKAPWTSIAEGPRYFVLESRPYVSISYGLRNIDDDHLDTIGEVYTQWSGDSANKRFDHGTGENSWNNIIVTYDASAALHTIYRNGSLVGTMSSHNPLAATAGLVIGAHRDPTNPSDKRHWDGRIDDVAVWNRVLTPAEIAAIQHDPVLSFNDIQADLMPLQNASVSWGDYDGDGDLDVALTGSDGTWYFAPVYENDGASGFAEITAGIQGAMDGGTSWADYDNDGDMDLLRIGNYGGRGYSILYSNDGAGAFTEIEADFPGIKFGAAAWADYDNDGDADVLLTGEVGADYVSSLYRNDGAGVFTYVEAGLPGLSRSAAAWGDYDNDGDLDLLLSGQTSAIYPYSPIARVYRNDSGTLVFDSGAALTGNFLGPATWVDYDSDGDLDILLCGFTGTQLYQSTGSGSFEIVYTQLPAYTCTSAAWGDYDNDGDADLLLALVGGNFRVYRNDGTTTFTDIECGLPGISSGSAAWGDFDGDGDLDILLAGSGTSEIYRNDGGVVNTAPASPTSLVAHLDGAAATFSWAPASDGQTPTAGLTYNLRIGTTPGGSEILSALAVGASGFRLLPQEGNVQRRSSWTITLPGYGSYYWSVQTIDGAYVGSSFAPEQHLEFANTSGFQDIAAGVPGVFAGSAQWGDYDGDGDLDVALTGDADSAYVARVMRSDGGGSFTDVGAELEPVRDGAVQWGDFDNDGDLDLVVAGATALASASTIYRNDGADAFTGIEAGLPGVRDASVAWGDYDNDGDLDLALIGDAASSGPPDPISRVYSNEAGHFADISAGLPGVSSGWVSWVDYDGDGDLDLFLCGDTGAAGLAEIYRNDGGVLVEDIGQTGLIGVSRAAGGWGDFDQDGDPDLALAGWTGTGYLTKIYRNDGGIFAAHGAGLPGLADGAVAWGDYDVDGDFDLLLSGDTGADSLTVIYRNDAGGFTADYDGFPGLTKCTAAWGDYDNDGDLDLLLTGHTASTAVSGIYRNDSALSNTPPNAPANLVVQINGSSATFSWSAAYDGQTPASGLSYNLRIGTTPGGSEILSAMSMPDDGRRSLPQAGNMGSRTSWAMTLPGVNDYYWSVQAVDPGYAGSAFPAVEGFGVDQVHFTPLTIGLPFILFSATAWGDYDNDGDLDFVLSGWTPDDGGDTTLVYQNDGISGFVALELGLPGVARGSLDWGDYDNDGDLDLLLTGSSPSFGPIARIYRNDGLGIFEDIGTGLPGAGSAGSSSAAWGDYDNDGDLDILLTGSSPSFGPIARIYRNDAGTFADIAAGLQGIQEGSAAWGDYDGDGDLDILVAGYTTSRVYRNDVGRFSDIHASLQDLGFASAEWGDYDGDGDLDILMSGWSGAGTTRLYRNDDEGVFTRVDVGLPDCLEVSGAIAWGDYDNDGDLDIAINGRAGAPSYSGMARVYRNDGTGHFVDVHADLAGCYYGTVAWADFDNDADLDLLTTGNGGGNRLYQCDGAPANTPSTAPTCSPAAVIGSRVQLKWSESTDAQTPAAGLTYNLRVGTTPGGEEVLASMADAASGFRRVAQMGNVQHRRWWTLQLPPGQYTWSVQAVDGAFIGSPFSASGAFTVTGAMPDLSISAAGLHAAREGDEGLVLSTVVRNVGLALAPGSVVRFFDAREDTALGADIMIPALAPGASDTCSIPWTARCGHDRFRAHVDPDGTLSEIYDRNNSAELSYGDSLAIPACSPEISITAKYGTLKTANHFGKYLRGIAGSQEEFKATFVDLDGVVDRLSFVIGSRAPVWVTAADQWTYRGFDPGSLTANDTLRVMAFAGQRPVSEEYIGILETRALPTWLSKWFDLGVGPVAMETRDGLPYLTFKLAMAREAKEPPDPEEDEPDTLAAADSSFIEFGDLIDPTIPIVGGKSSKFKLDVTLKVWAPLLEGKSWLAEGHLKKEAEVFGRDNTEEVGVKIWLSESGVDSLLLDPPYKNTLHLWKSPEIESPPFNVAGLQIVFGVAMDLFLHAQVEAWAQDNFDSLLVVFTPSLEADINVVGTVSLAALKFAKVEVIANPNVELGPVFTYARGPNIGNDFDLGGFFQFTLNGRVVASITYKVWKYKKTSSWTVVTFPTYIWRKDFHLAGKPGSGLLALAGEADTSYVDTTEVYVPDVFPYPNAASDTSGTVGFVWIQDVDPDPDIAEPQVYYAEKAPEEADWSLESVTADDLFKSYATFAYLPGGDPIAVWVQASNTEDSTDVNWTLSEVLDRQDLWCAGRDSGGVWTPAPVFTEVGGMHRADGVPAMTPTASGATLAWVRCSASADSALAPGSGEIYASSYASGSWSAPYALTADNIDDTSPAICTAGADTSVVLWVREDAVAGLPNELVWSKGTGSAWQSPQVLSGGLSNWTKQPPSVTKAEDGRLLASWVETEQITVPVDSVNTQNKVVYHLRASTLAAGGTAWSPIEEVFVDSSFVECPIALIDRRNIGAITWRGYNGMDGDLWISLRDLDKAGSTWTLPRCIAPDNLTDWMATATLDADNNLYLVNQQSNLSEPPEPPSGKALFPGGLRLRTKGISSALDLTDLPNRGFRPLTGDLTLGVDSLWVQGATPTVSETDTLVAYVKNIGDYEIAAGGLVRFYQGHPDSAGSFALVPDAALPAMAPDDSVQVKAPWPVAAGTHRLYAVVDPGEVIAEQDDNNNLAYLAVSIVPDLAVDSVRVSDPNPEPGDEVTLRAYVRNVGASPAQDYSVRFSARSGTLDTLTGLTLPPGASATLEMPFTVAQGVDTLYAVIDDPDSLLADPDSTNNRAWEPLRVLPDLAVWIKLRDDVPDSIRFSEGFEESLSVTIANVGGVALDPEDAVKVRILSGNPRAGGVPLLADIAWPIAFPPGFPVGTQDSMLVAWSDIDPMLDSLGVPLDVDGVPIEPIAIFAVVDPEGTIEERTTLNNEDFLSIGDGLPQLTMLDGSIAIRPVDGAVDTVSAFVQNLGTTGCQAVLVEFFAGDPDTGGYLIDDRLIPRLVPGETARAWVTWDTPQENITVFAIVDRPQLIAEYNEADNRISQEFSLVVDVPTTPTVPVTLALHPAFPNPFSGSTTISFDLPKQGRVEVAVFDVTGRLVRTLLDQELPPGRQTLEWDGRSNTQRATATGIYFVRLRVNDELLTRKIVRLK